MSSQRARFLGKQGQTKTSLPNLRVKMFAVSFLSVQNRDLFTAKKPEKAKNGLEIVRSAGPVYITALSESQK
jgi:hypothetical protein